MVALPLGAGSADPEEFQGVPVDAGESGRRLQRSLLKGRGMGDIDILDEAAGCADGMMMMLAADSELVVSMVMLEIHAADNSCGCQCLERPVQGHLVERAIHELLYLMHGERLGLAREYAKKLHASGRRA